MPGRAVVGSGGTPSATASDETCSRAVKKGVNADAPRDKGGKAVREDLEPPESAGRRGVRSPRRGRGRVLGCQGRGGSVSRRGVH